MQPLQGILYRIAGQFYIISDQVSGKRALFFRKDKQAEPECKKQKLKGFVVVRLGIKKGQTVVVCPFPELFMGAFYSSMLKAC